MGKELDTLSASSAGLGTKMRKLSEVLVQCTMYILAPFNYPADMSGLQAYAMAMHSALSPSSNSAEYVFFSIEPIKKKSLLCFETHHVRFTMLQC